MVRRFLMIFAVACVSTTAAWSDDASDAALTPPLNAPAAATPGQAAPAEAQAAPAPQSPSADAQTASAPATAASAISEGLKAKLATRPIDADDQTAKEFAEIASFYEARGYAPLWVSDAGLMQRGKDLIAALKDANAYGLEAGDFAIPAADGGADADKLSATELTLTRSALLYARYARGGRIMKPSEMLNSNLDRKPQLLEPKVVLDGLAATDNSGAYLTGTNPKHPQFEKLRQAFLAAGGAEAGQGAGNRKSLSAAAKRLRANMEMWRWMYDDMGELYVFNNIPEFMQYVYKDGKIIRAEKIVAGMVDKQSSIFSRPLKYVVLRPKWRVPESIMVKELWPSLLRGGGLMRQYGLQLETKEGETLDWRRINWAKDDIRNYIVTQAPGPKSVLGVVKFSFPSQHTIFMHDTPDKWMFKPAQRTLSHGCLRVWKPVELAEIILDYDKGWDKAKVAELIRSGPLNNEVELDKRVMINLVYFTAWVDDNGKMRAFPDIYGHERRVIQALDGQWDRIAKGRDHLAPPEPNFNPKTVAATSATQQSQQKRQAQTTGDLLSNVFGGLGF